MKINWFKINSNEIILWIFSILMTSSTSFSLSSFFGYLKQGFNCKDCNQKYCRCNSCGNCKLNYCLCEYDLRFSSYYDNSENLKYKFKVRKIIEDFMFKNMNNDLLIELKNKLLEYMKRTTSIENTRLFFLENLIEKIENENKLV